MQEKINSLKVEVDDHRQELLAGEKPWSLSVQRVWVKGVPGAELLSSRTRLEPEGFFSGEHSGEKGTAIQNRLDLIFLYSGRR